LITLLRPVAARASRSADIVASVPEETRRTISSDGTASTMRSASSTSASVGAPYTVPRRSARSTASSTTGWRCPRIIGP
jgi:hypothetical protein